MITLPTNPSAIDVIDNYLGQTFDSHEFIQKFIKYHEREYVEGLYSAIYSAGGIFRAYHAKIGRLLADNQKTLGIRPIESVTSLNIKDYESENMMWTKA